MSEQEWWPNYFDEADMLLLEYASFDTIARQVKRYRLAFFDHLDHTVFIEVAVENVVEWREVYDHMRNRPERIHWTTWQEWLSIRYGAENVNCWEGCTEGFPPGLLDPDTNGGRASSHHIGRVYLDRGSMQ